MLSLAFATRPNHTCRVAMSTQIDEVLAAGLRTGDLNIGGGPTVGCAAMGSAIADKVVELA